MSSPSLVGAIKSSTPTYAMYNYHTATRRILGDLRLISTGFATLQRAVYAA